MICGTEKIMRDENEPVQPPRSKVKVMKMVMKMKTNMKFHQAGFEATEQGEGSRRRWRGCSRIDLSV